MTKRTPLTVSEVSARLDEMTTLRLPGRLGASAFFFVGSSIFDSGVQIP
jgi:hypothetical protein